MRSLLGALGSAAIELDPFPHVVLPDALPDDLCRRLIAEYPRPEWFAGTRPRGENRRWSWPAALAGGDVRLSASWRELIAGHVSPAFLAQVLAAFREPMRSLYPLLEDELGPCEGWRAGLRGRDTFAAADVLLDAQICLNTPATASTSVRGFHVDLPDKLFVGLYYMKTPDDRSSGGDLQMARFRSVPRYRGHEVEAAHVEVVKTIPYARNVLVMFLNGPHAIHGVTARGAGPCPRLFVNLVGAVRKPLFDLAPHQDRAPGMLPAARRMLSALRQRVRA